MFTRPERLTNKEIAFHLQMMAESDDYGGYDQEVMRQAAAYLSDPSNDHAETIRRLHELSLKCYAVVQSAESQNHIALKKYRTEHHQSLIDEVLSLIPYLNR